MPRLRRNNYLNRIYSDNDLVFNNDNNTLLDLNDTINYDDILHHNVLDNTQSPYTNDDLINTMTNISGGL